ncbi:MAG: lysostaphin resistance A-like protein [Clostridia bacterium]
MKEKIALKIKGVTFGLLYIAIYLIAQSCLFIEAEYLEGDGVNYSGFVTLVAALFSLGIYAVIMYLRDQKFNKVIKVRRVALLDVAVAFSLAIGFRILTGVYLRWAETVPVLSKSLEDAEALNQDFTTMTMPMMLALMLSICIVGPIFEEILFRGLVLREFSNVMNAYVAIVLQAIFFGIAHGVLTQAVFAVVYGVILGVLYHKTKNIAIVSLGHIFFNCSVILEIRSDDDLVTLFVIGLMMTVISLAIFLYMYRKRHEKPIAEDLGGNYNG